MDLFHWHYFLALEDDVVALARYVEFESSNLAAFSVEMARILMAATQELDVILKQLCDRHGDSSTSEGGYRRFLPTKYPSLSGIEVTLYRGELKFKPFESWAVGNTPSWWPANNKVKHERHSHFHQASLGAVLEAMCGLFLANLFFHVDCPNPVTHYPGTRLFDPEGCIKNISPTRVGIIVNYKLP